MCPVLKAKLQIEVPDLLLGWYKQIEANYTIVLWFHFNLNGAITIPLLLSQTQET